MLINQACDELLHEYRILSQKKKKKHEYRINYSNSEL